MTSATPLSVDRARPGAVSLSGYVAVTVLAVTGGALLVAAAVDLTDGARAAGGLAGTGGPVLVLGLLGRRIVRRPQRLRLAATVGAAVAAWVVASVVGAVSYLLTGVVDRPDDALFEAVAGFTTTALTTVTGVQDLPTGVLVWRALTQWLGGLAAIAVIIAVLPSIGAGGLQTVESAERSGSSHLLGPRVLGVLRRIAVLYAALTAVVVVAYRIAGMGPLDAVAHGLTTASTGGFSTHDESFAHFGSAAIEWVAVGGMLVAGANVALVWRAVRRRSVRVLRSAELGAYVAIVAVAWAAVAVWTGQDAGFTHESVRHAGFSVVSVLSTTGYTVVDWTEWVVPAQLVLLLLLGVGAMAGSTGGGFTVLRLLALIGYIRRELVRQLHPRSVRVVRIGRAVADETQLDRMVGYQVLYLLLVSAGAVMVAATGEDVVTAASAAVSAMATAGPALGDLAPGLGASEVGSAARAVLMVAMLAGRLEIYPLVITIAGLGAAARRLAPAGPSARLARGRFGRDR